MILHSERINDTLTYSIVDNIYVVCNDVINRAKLVDEENDAISIYAPSSIAKYIVKELVVKLNKTWFHRYSVNKLLFIEDTDVVITLYGDRMVFIEEARCDGMIKDNSDSVYTYIHDSFKKSEVDELNKNDGEIFVFGFFD
jgi:hypothetical protein